jgi:hypothetical protein
LSALLISASSSASKPQTGERSALSAVCLKRIVYYPQNIEGPNNFAPFQEVFSGLERDGGKAPAASAEAKTAVPVLYGPQQDRYVSGLKRPPAVLIDQISRAQQPVNLGSDPPPSASSRSFSPVSTRQSSKAPSVYFAPSAGAAFQPPVIELAQIAGHYAAEKAVHRLHRQASERKFSLRLFFFPPPLRRIGKGGVLSRIWRGRQAEAVDRLLNVSHHGDVPPVP